MAKIEPWQARERKYAERRDRAIGMTLRYNATKVEEDRYYSALRSYVNSRHWVREDGYTTCFRLRDAAVFETDYGTPPCDWWVREKKRIRKETGVPHEHDDWFGKVRASDGGL